MESGLAILHEGTCGTSWCLIYNAWQICPNTVAISLKLCQWFFKQKGCIHCFIFHLSNQMMINHSKIMSQANPSYPKKKEIDWGWTEKKRLNNSQVVHPKQTNATLSQFLLCRIAVTEKICFTFSNPKTNDSRIARWTIFTC